MRYEIKGPSYDGSDLKKRCAAREEFLIAEKVADFLNARASKLLSGEKLNILSHQVARQIEEDHEIVRGIIRRYQGGSNGMFIYGG